MTKLLNRQQQDILTAATGFNHGWEAALDEAILIAETVVFEAGDAVEVVNALRKFRDENNGPISQSHP